mmetsp:Transcript_33318/g.71395  ORF Transcript_33318/g.71395 Transcript_33318/m.71395 type:complete len:80 (-) Transcript_33318:961-1200(-)
MPRAIPKPRLHRGTDFFEVSSFSRFFLPLPFTLSFYCGVFWQRRQMPTGASLSDDQRWMTHLPCQACQAQPKARRPTGP